MVVNEAAGTVTVGTRKHGERLFRLLRSVSYRRKDGTETTLRVWRGFCVVCGEGFEVTTPSTGHLRRSGSFEVVTCATHRGKA